MAALILCSMVPGSGSRGGYGIHYLVLVVQVVMVFIIFVGVLEEAKFFNITKAIQPLELIVKV